MISRLRTEEERQPHHTSSETVEELAESQPRKPGRRKRATTGAESGTTDRHVTSEHLSAVQLEEVENIVTTVLKRFKNELD